MDGLTILLAMSGYLGGLVMLTGQDRRFRRRLAEKDEVIVEYRREIVRLQGVVQRYSVEIHKLRKAVHGQEMAARTQGAA